MADKLLSFLGLCRKAGKLAPGHDASLESVLSGKAKLCLLMSDGSERLKNEFKKAASYDGRTLEVIETEYTSQQLRAATGVRAAVITINDEGFAKRTAELHRAIHEEELL